MASVHDVAAYILKEHGSMSTWKLQKLVYYTQAWRLAWDGEPLFDDPIQAWANGPVVRALYDKHRGWFAVDKWPGNPSALSKDERDTIDAVLRDYGHLTGRQLSHLTHSELPWREARQGLAATDRSSRRIKRNTMQTFYAALDTDESAQPVKKLDWSASD